MGTQLERNGVHATVTAMLGQVARGDLSAIIDQTFPLVCLEV